MLQSASPCEVTLARSAPSHSRQMVHGSLRAHLTRQFSCGRRRLVLQSASLCEVTLAGSTRSHSRQMVHGSLRAQRTKQFGCGMRRPVLQSASLFMITLDQSNMLYSHQMAHHLHTHMTGIYYYRGHISTMVVPHQMLTAVQQVCPLLMWFPV